ncbi:2'-5' RNA ligase family protein [Streptomyces sp. NPDC008139]|uniref:2'-5' RNA ligase family protein n=1 Tax=Streptomyces sp. NPDC008139 TaxID=3364814 RepID=UPI0036EB508E
MTFDDQADVHRFAAEYRAALAPVGGLDLIPDRWLHLTMQGVGFVGEVPEDTVDAIAEAAKLRLAVLPQFAVTLGTPVVDPEAILVPVQPADSVRRLRDVIRAAIGDVLPEVPETASGFTPHVSVAYSNTTGPSTPFTEAITNANIAPATARVTNASLIRINRDHQMYQWSTIAEIPLG